MITVGSLTNVALAIKVDPEFLGRLTHLYVGAGHIESKCTLGNLAEISHSPRIKLKYMAPYPGLVFLCLVIYHDRKYRLFVHSVGIFYFFILFGITSAINFCLSIFITLQFIPRPITVVFLINCEQ